MGAGSGREFLGMRGNALVMLATESVGQGVLFLITPFWGLYVLEMGASLTTLGLLALILGLVRLALQAPVGYLTDRLGRKKLVVWGGLIASLAPLAYFLAPRWEYLIPGVVLEAFMNVVLPARQAMFADAVDPERRATAFAAIHTLFAVFSSFMPVISGYLLEASGFVPGMRTAFLVTGAVMLLAGVARAIYLKEDVDVDRESHGAISLSEVLRETFEPVFALRSLRVALFGAFLYSLAVGFLTKFSVVYAVDIIGLSKTQWGLVVGGVGAVGILTRLPTGWMIDRLGRRLCILLSYAARPLFILAFTVSRGFPQVLLVQILENSFGYIQQPALEALVIDTSSQRRRGRSYGAFNMVPGIALTVAPVLGASIWEASGPVWAFYSSALFSALAAAVILAFLREPVKREL